MLRLLRFPVSNPWLAFAMAMLFSLGTGAKAQLPSNTAFHLEAGGFISFSTSSGLPQGNSPRTVAFWLFPLPSNDAVVSWGESRNCTPGREYLVAINEQPDLVSQGSCGLYVSAPLFSLTFYQWQHIVAIWDGENATTIRDDGLTAEERGLQALDTGLGCYFFGKRCAGENPSAFRGYFTDVRIWNRELSSAEASAAYQDAQAPDSQGLVAWFNGTANALGQIVDNSPSANVGLFDSEHPGSLAESIANALGLPCISGWQFSASHTDPVCSGHGQCAANQTCVCEARYTGSYCQISLDDCDIAFDSWLKGDPLSTPCVQGSRTLANNTSCSVTCKNGLDVVGGGARYTCNSGVLTETASLRCGARCTLPPLGPGVIAVSCPAPGPDALGWNSSCELGCDGVTYSGVSSTLTCSNGTLTGRQPNCTELARCDLPSFSPGVKPAGPLYCYPPGVGALRSGLSCTVGCCAGITGTGSSVFSCFNGSLTERASLTCSAGPSVCDQKPELMYFTFDGRGTTVPNQASSPVGANPATLQGLSQGSVGQYGGGLVGSGQAGIQMDTQWATNLTGNWTLSLYLNNIRFTPLRGNNEIFGGASMTAFCQRPNDFLLVLSGVPDILVPNACPNNGTGAVTHIVHHAQPNASVGAVSAYLNGVFVSSVAAQEPFLVNGRSTLKVGGNYYEGLFGILDEFRLYSRALSPEEIASTWNISFAVGELVNDPATTGTTGTIVEAVKSSDSSSAAAELGAGAIVGIVILAIIVCFLIAGLIYLAISKQKSRDPPNESETGTDQEGSLESQSSSLESSSDSYTQSSDSS